MCKSAAEVFERLLEMESRMESYAVRFIYLQLLK